MDNARFAMEIESHSKNHNERLEIRYNRLSVVMPLVMRPRLTRLKVSEV